MPDFHPYSKAFYFDQEISRWKVKTVKKRGSSCMVLMCRNLVNNTRICSKCRGRLYALNNPLGRVVSKLRSRSKRKGIEFDLTVEYLKSLPLIEHYMTQRAENPNQFHIDRIDPLKGYVKGNIRVVEASENLRKAYTDKKVHEWERQRLNGQEEMPWEDQMDEEIECPF